MVMQEIQLSVVELCFSKLLDWNFFHMEAKL